MPAVRVECPECQAQLKVVSTVVGKKIRCPSCQKPFVVRPEEEDDEESRRRRTGRKQEGSGVALILGLVLGGGALVLVLIAVGGWLLFRDKGTTTSAAPNQPFAQRPPEGPFPPGGRVPPGGFVPPGGQVPPGGFVPPAGQPPQVPNPPSTGEPSDGVTPGSGLPVLEAVKLFPTDSNQRGPHLVLSPDGSQAVTVIEGGHLWDTATGKELPWKDPETANSMKEDVKCAVFSADGSHLWASLYSQRIIAIDTKTHKIDGQIPTETSGSSVLRISPGGKYIATGGGVYDVPARKLKFKFARELGDQSEVVFSRDDRTLIGRGQRGLVDGFKGITLWSLDSGKVAHKIDIKTADDLLENQFIASSPTSDTFAVRTKQGDDNVVEIRDLASAEVKATLGKGMKLSEGHLAGSPDGKLLTVLVDRGFVKDHFEKALYLLDAASGKPVASLSPPLSLVEAVAFSADGSKLATLGRRAATDNDKPDLLLWDISKLRK